MILDPLEEDDDLDLDAILEGLPELPNLDALDAEAMTDL